MAVSSSLTNMDDDILIAIVFFLQPPDILRLAQTCKSLHALATIRVVWIQAVKTHVLSQGYPFPDTQIDDLPTLELIELTTRSFLLGNRWCTGLSAPKRMQTIAGTSGTSVSDVRFIPGHGGTLLVLIGRNVWSNLSVWATTGGMQCEWSPRGAIFTGFAVNSDGQSTATMAVSLLLNERHIVVILNLDHGGSVLTETHSLHTPMIPVTLSGNLIALSDDKSETMIWNWHSGTRALLKYSSNTPTDLQSNDCSQVLFDRDYIFVARARSIHLFLFPALSSDSIIPTHEPVAQHSFGWVDSQCMTIDAASTYILLRGEIDDPWASTTHNLDLYTFSASNTDDSESNTTPYNFPPHLCHSVASLHGSLRCKKVALGRCGTALWLQPRDHFSGGLVDDTQHQLASLPGSSATRETLVAAVFSKSLSPGPDTPVVGRKVYENHPGSSWAAFDYDEVGGRVALASSFSPVQILYL